MNMILSVCITTFNLEKYIDRTLESVVNQNFNQQYEILIGDDGSDDETINRVKHWQERYPGKISLFIMPREPGVKYNPIYRASVNRVNLLRNAKGKYITFLDGDDYYINNDKFKKQIEILENPQNCDCVMCAHNMNFYYEATDTEKPIIPYEIHEQKMSARYYWGKARLWVHAEAFIFRKSFLTEANLKKFNLQYFDDNLIVFFFLKYGKIYYIPDVMANYRQNITEWKSKSNLEQHILNAMDLSVERKYNSKMFITSLRRHYLDYEKLYDNKEYLSDKLYRHYIEQSEEQNLSEVLLFLCYKNLNRIGRCKTQLFFWFISIINYRLSVQKLLNRLYWRGIYPIRQKFFRINKS